MQKWIGLWFASLIAVAVLASVAMRAQTRLLERDYRIISGADVGFRIEGTDITGKPKGRWMVRIDGQWEEPSGDPISRRLNNY